MTEAAVCPRVASGSAAFAEERHPDAAWRGGRAFLPLLDVPARALVAARRTQQRNPAILEVQERIVAVQRADELPQLLANTRHDSGGFGVCSVVRRRLD